MKLRATLAIALAGAFLALVGPVTSAVAYPASVCSTLSVSTTNPNPGESITVTGAAFLPNASVHLVLKPGANNSTTATYDLKTVVASATGAFTTSVTLPTATVNQGNFDLKATTGADTSNNCPPDPFATLDFGAATAGGGGGGSGSGSNGGGTAFTGVNVALMLVVAAGLIGGGVVLNRRSRAKLYTGQH